MVNVMVGVEGAVLNFHSHFLVGISERHAICSKPVDLFNRKHWVIHRVVQYFPVHFHTVDDIRSHFEAGSHFVKGRQEYLLYCLQVSEISTWQIVHHHHYLLWHCL